MNDSLQPHEEPVAKNVHVNGVRLCYFERGIAHRGNGPTLLFVHATGFHGRIWDQIIARLPPVHSIAIDQRGHGRSERVLINHWSEVIEDAVQVIDQLALSNVLAVGHSMGAHALIGAAARQRDSVRRIVAIDPVISDPADYTDSVAELNVDEHPVTKRRSRFTSVDEMIERLTGKGSFDRFDPRMFDDYCRYGLLPHAEGGFELACSPASEASVYLNARTNGAIYEAVRAVQQPVLILRARRPAPDRAISDFSSSPTSPGLVAEFANAREHFFADRTHFLPMEIPDTVAAMIRREMGRMTGQAA